MSSFDSELRGGLELILGVPVPAPEYEAFLFFKQWLGERNLGSVPIASPRDFAWPGHWLARVHSDGRDHAVVMFGSPSGPLHDPAGALADGGTIEEGWLLARLDVRLPIEEPYGQDRGAGSIAGIFTAPEAEAPLSRSDTAEANAGHGLAGDRYFAGRGTFSGPDRGHELTLIEAEALESVDLPWEQARRNLVTRGIALNALVGQRFTIGEVLCVGRRLAEPCAHLEKLSRPGLLRPLVHRAGLRADILTDGTIAVGDRIVIAE